MPWGESYQEELAQVLEAGLEAFRQRYVIMVYEGSSSPGRACPLISPTACPGVAGGGPEWDALSVMSRAGQEAIFSS